MRNPLCGHERPQPDACRVCRLWRDNAQLRHVVGTPPTVEQCEHRGDALTGHEREAAGLDHRKDWRHCLHVDKPLGAHVCPCQGCGPKCRGYQSATGPRRMAAVSCFYNPSRYKRPLDNWHLFAAAATRWGIPLYTIELAYDDEPFQTHAAVRVRGDHRHKLWQKERLLNLLVERHVPAEYDAIAWVDADILFMNRDWAAHALHALQTHTVIQPWVQARPTCKNGTFNYGKGGDWWKSMGSGGDHRGYAWAARRELFPLYDGHVAGSGDTAMVMAWGVFHQQMYWDAMNEPWTADLRAYGTRTAPLVGGRVGHCPGDIVHLYHGEGKNRLYMERWKYLTDHAYDPAADVEVCPDTGLLRWATDKPDMHRKMAAYSAERKEDD